MVPCTNKKILRISQVAAAFSLSLLSTTSLSSQDFSCNPRGRTCNVYDRQLVTGDQLGFFSDEGQLIATGKVTDMKGSLRSVTLYQSRGSVSDDATSYAMIDTKHKRFAQTAVLYQRPSPYAVSTFLGIASMSAGSDAAGRQISTSAIRRRFLGNFDGFFKASQYSIEGSAYNPGSSELSKKFALQSFIGSSGLSYSLIQQSAFTLRTEFGLGLSYTSAKIGGSERAAASPDWGYTVKSGIAPHLSGLLAASYRVDRYALEAGISPASLAGKAVNSIGAGLLVNLN